MPGRPQDPNTGYRVYIRFDKKYKYVAVQIPINDNNNKRLKYKIIQLGKIDDNLIFTPNVYFRLISPEEKRKFVFPKKWDLSKIDMNTKNENINKII